MSHVRAGGRGDLRVVHSGPGARAAALLLKYGVERRDATPVFDLQVVPQVDGQVALRGRGRDHGVVPPEWSTPAGWATLGQPVERHRSSLFGVHAAEALPSGPHVSPEHAGTLLVWRVAAWAAVSQGQGGHFVRAARPTRQEERIALIELADRGGGVADQWVGGADILGEDVDHGDVVPHLLGTGWGRLRTGTAEDG